MTDQEDTQTYANDSATSSPINTGLAQLGSRDVLRDLIVKRNRVGAESQIGGLLSTLIEQVQNHREETDDIARANLERLMGGTVRKLKMLMRTA